MNFLFYSLAWAKQKWDQCVRICVCLCGREGGLGRERKGESDIVWNLIPQLTTLCYCFQLFTALLVRKWPLVLDRNPRKWSSLEAKKRPGKRALLVFRLFLFCFVFCCLCVFVLGRCGMKEGNNLSIQQLSIRDKCWHLSNIRLMCRAEREELEIKNGERNERRNKNIRVADANWNEASTRVTTWNYLNHRGDSVLSWTKGSKVTRLIC